MKSDNIDVSVIVVSFNTRQLLDECLRTIQRESQDLAIEIIVVDNDSKDGTAAHIKKNWPYVHLIESSVNLGFAAANNIAFKHARGRYYVLLNSDAMLRPGSLQRAVRNMDSNSHVGIAGARLIGEDGSWQPSARMFPSLWSSFCLYSGLASKCPTSRLFGRFDRTWASPDISAEVDWVPGAFAIIRPEALHKVGDFDERFFLYYEEVDLCRRLKEAGYTVAYWPDVVVTHLLGQSARTLKDGESSYVASQLTLWRMRSELLYFRKHHGLLGAYGSLLLETAWHQLRLCKSTLLRDAALADKTRHSRDVIKLKWKAWEDTQHGLVSPSRPWIIETDTT